MVRPVLDTVLTDDYVLYGIPDHAKGGNRKGSSLNVLQLQQQAHLQQSICSVRV